MFEIIGTANGIDFELNCKHMADRNTRVNKANQLIHVENATIIASFEINKGHKNGTEIHVIYNNGIIRIYNTVSKKHITDLIAREPQVTRYGVKVTKTMRKKIKNHIENGYNTI
jgi:hypothetical protein